MILFLGKKIIKDTLYWEIFYKGVVTLVRVNQELYDRDLFVGQQLEEELFEETFYKDGFKNILSLKIKK